MKKSMFLPLVLLILTLGPMLRVCQADTINVAVAANFSAPMQALTEVFEQQNPHHVQLATGSSGKFFAQISQGAPFDVFLSADQNKPLALVEQHLALADSRFTYALGALALWSASFNKVDNKGQILFSNDFNKLALANPRLAPYGQAATEVLQALGLTDSTRTRWVQGENIAQTYQFVASHNADLGFVALSQIYRDGNILSGSAWIIPATLYQPIKQDAVILNRGKDKAAVSDFVAFLRSAKAQQLIESYGYQLAESP